MKNKELEKLAVLLLKKLQGWWASDKPVKKSSLERVRKELNEVLKEIENLYGNN